MAVTYEDGKEIEVPVLVTDKKGYAKSVELPYGQYVVAETKTPEKSETSPSVFGNCKRKTAEIRRNGESFDDPPI